jgi:hypothetical protein
MEKKSADMFKNGIDKAFSSLPNINSDVMRDANTFKKDFTESKKTKKSKKVKKTENKEATTSGSSGAFVSPIQFSDDFLKKSNSENKKLKESEHSDKIPGGLSKGKTLKDIVKKHKVDYLKLVNEFKKGVKVEKEHTSDINIAKEIAMDHLMEDPNYYTKLTKIESITESDKIEATEATGTASTGSYETPSAWAKSTSKKNWGGKRKTQIPGGKFVTVKKKCKKFPYCNQGDIKALDIYENKNVKDAISNVSKKMGISETVIKSIIQHELERIKNLNK